MTDLQQQNKALLDACSTGDIPKLEALFKELNIGPKQPRVYFDNSIPQDQRTPVVVDMLCACIRGQQSEKTLPFLLQKFPGSSLNDYGIQAAIDTGDAERVKLVCGLDPAAANGFIGRSNVIVYACTKPENAEIAAVLLDAGADPNKDPECVPPFSNFSYAVTGGMPLSTLERFFDAGYSWQDHWALSFAIKHGRKDVVELLFTRGKDLPDHVEIPPKEELIHDAEENGDVEMVATINRFYPKLQSTKKKGILAWLFKRRD